MCSPDLQVGNVFMLKQKLYNAQWIFTSTCLSGSQYRNGIRGRCLVTLPVNVQLCSPRINCLLTSLDYTIVELALLGFEPHINGIMQCAVSEPLVQPVRGACRPFVLPLLWQDSVLQLTSSAADGLWFVFSFLLSQRKFTWISEIYALNFVLSAFSILWVLLCSSSWVWSLWIIQASFVLQVWTVILLPHPPKCWDYSGVPGLNIFLFF